VSGAPRLVEVRAKVMKQNDLLARALRDRFRSSGVYVVSMVSSPGSGKTAFLEMLLARLSVRYRVAALVGDLATENDAMRLKRAAPQVRQITTGTICHLDAEMVRKALDGWDLDALDFLFIENVGNLVCPSSYDLGEELRLVLLSTTEGEDKPLKYPTIFHGADVAVLTKMDLAQAAEFNLAAARENIQRVRPGMQMIEVSSRTGQGIDAAVELLESRRASAGGASVPASSAAAPF
jgi:hydrogenase nickel incorporation protein HypB